VHVRQECVESNMSIVNTFCFSWITGLMFGLEFLFEDEAEQMNYKDHKFKFGFALDLGIIRILYQRFVVLK